MPGLVMALGGEREGEREILLRSEIHAASDAKTAPEASVLFAELRAAVCRYVISQGLSSHDADEVTQETFLRLHRHLAGRELQERQDDNLRGWIFRVARNLARDHRRRLQPRVMDSLEASKEARQALDVQAGPEQQLLEEERAARLHRAMEALPLRQQQCLRLRAEGLRYREIAEALGIGVTTVADAIHEALTRLEKACP